MGKRILFLMDDVNYKGGAHFAVFNQIKLLHRNNFGISVFSLIVPANMIREDLPFVDFMSPAKHWWNNPFFKKIHKRNEFDEGALLNTINSFDIVCVPFENSIFRNVASLSNAYKIQWIHINYSLWKNISPGIQKITADDRALYRNYDKIVFVSREAEKGFSLLYPELKNKTTVCYNLFDMEKIRLPSQVTDASAADNKKVFRIVTVTRIYELQKAIKRTLDIIKKLKDEGYDFTWTFVGEGEDLNDMQKYSKALGLDTQVTWTGYVDDPPYSYMKNADLFALFSYYEGNPITIYEALAAGTPVISTHYGVNEDYTPADTGWNAENNEKSIYEGLKFLLDNKELVYQAKCKLKDYIYDNTKCENEILDVFEKAVLAEKEQIPKKIHYCWFGGNPLSECYQKCIASWERCAPDFEIIRWDETNCDIHENLYVEQAYNNKKWAFVSDYFRLKILYENGGIYMDTDVELTGDVNFLRNNGVFFSFETNNVNACMFGTQAHNYFIKELLDTYNNDCFINQNGEMLVDNTIVNRLTKLFESKYKLKYNCVDQKLPNNITIYAPDVLLINVFNGRNTAIHHYSASWNDTSKEINYTHEVMKYYFEIYYHGFVKYLILKKAKSFLKFILPSKSYTFLKKKLREAFY
jgi:glycosyltransferase involved in cell wall biosynthesis